MLGVTSNLTCIGNGETSLVENWQMAPGPVTTFQNQPLVAPTVSRPISRHAPADRLKTATLTVAPGAPPLFGPRTAVSEARKSWPNVDTAICLVVAPDVDAGDACANPSGSRVADNAVIAKISPAVQDRSLFTLPPRGCGLRELRREKRQIVHPEMELVTERIGRAHRPSCMASASGTGERFENEAGQRWDRAIERTQEVVAVEARLLARARTGDLDAFVQLIGLHDRALRALAYRLLEDSHQMDDALQEAYLKAFRALRGFEGRSAFGSWMRRIVYNVCMDQLRQRSSGSRRISLGVADEMPDPMPDPGEVAAQRVDLAAALASLPPKMRATVLMVDAEGMDYQAVADVLGVPVGTVRSRLSQARRLLRRALSEDKSGHERP